MIEKKLNKGEILERYFNQVAYGGETYGVAEAAIKYFGKEVDQINLAEATFWQAYRQRQVLTPQQ